MNDDAREHIDHLVETIDNGRLGLAEASKRLSEREYVEMSSTFLRLSEERKTFAAQLRDLTTVEDDTAHSAGTTPGLLHRGFIAVADAVTGDSPTPLLNNVVSGETHAISVYEKVLEADLPAEVRAAIELQLVSVRASHKLAAALLAQSLVKRQ